MSFSNDDRKTSNSFDFKQNNFRFIQVTEDQIGFVIFDAHGSLGQDEDYLDDPFQRQYEDYLRLAR